MHHLQESQESIYASGFLLERLTVKAIDCFNFQLYLWDSFSLTQSHIQGEKDLDSGKSLKRQLLGMSHDSQASFNNFFKRTLVSFST